MRRPAASTGPSTASGRSDDDDDSNSKESRVNYNCVAVAAVVALFLVVGTPLLYWHTVRVRDASLPARLKDQLPSVRAERQAQHIAAEEKKVSATGRGIETWIENGRSSTRQGRQRDGVAWVPWASLDGGAFVNCVAAAGERCCGGVTSEMY